MSNIIKQSISGDKADIFIDRSIGTDPGEISAKQFKSELAEINPDAELDIFFDSNGGGVSDGKQIYSAIRAHPGRTTAHIQGLAASIASVIAMACDEVFISADGLFMIHNPHWSVSRSESRCSVGGQRLINIPHQQKLIEIPTLQKNNSRHSIEMMRRSVNKHRNTSAERRRLLEADREFILNTYFLRTGAKREDLRQMMAEETWFSAWDCIQFGFADHISSPTGLVDHVDFSQFSNPTNFLAGRFMDSAKTARSNRLKKVNRKQTEFMRATVQKILNQRQHEV